MSEKARRTPLTAAQYAQKRIALGLTVDQTYRPPPRHHLSRRQRRDLGEIGFNKPYADKSK